MFKEARNKSEYSGFINLVLEKKDNKTIAVKKYYEGLVKISPTIKMDIENIPTYYLLQLGGGYIEGEKYKSIFKLENEARAIITTQASAKVYKCLNGIKIEQDTEIYLGENSILEYITDSVILYKDAIYKQVNNIYLDESSTLIYSDGITAGWSPEGENFKYKSVQLKSNVYINNKLVLSPRCRTEEDVEKQANKYDCVICGSDQTWNLDPSVRYQNAVYFLNFPKHQRRISYATSFGQWVEKAPEHEDEFLP